MRKALFVLLTFGLLSLSASAATVTWTLSGVTFSDGGTATGTFVYDVDHNTYTAVNVTTTAGTVITSAANLRYVSPGLVPSSVMVLTGASNAADLTGTRAFALFFSSPLNNAGGTRTISGQEANCSNATCSGPAAPSRAVTAGSVTATDLGNPIPTLSTWGMMAIGLLLAAAGIVAIRRGGL